MTIFEAHLPQEGENLAEYVKRCRTQLKLSQRLLRRATTEPALTVGQADMALKVGINIQSLGKIESGKTHRLNSKPTFRTFIK